MSTLRPYAARDRRPAVRDVCAHVHPAATAAVMTAAVLPLAVAGQAAAGGVITPLSLVAALCAAFSVLIVAAPLGGAWRLGAAALAGPLAEGVLATLSTTQHAVTCLPIMGQGARMALRLGFVRADTACASGSMAETPTGHLATMACLALATLLAGQCAAALVAAHAADALRELHDLARDLWHHVVALLLTTVSLVTRPAPRRIEGRRPRRTPAPGRTPGGLRAPPALA